MIHSKRGITLISAIETILISNETLARTKSALERHGINVNIVDTKGQALQLLKNIIPSGVEVMIGTSTTLQEIGFIDFYKSNQHTWKNIGSTILLEPDTNKRTALRRKSITSQYFTASVNAITEDGLLVAVDGTGSRVGAYPFGAEKLILVSGINKIVPCLQDAFDRIKNEVYPLEDARAMEKYGHHTVFGKWVIIENEGVKDRITLILVKENLGF